jgi:hypothetical protein
MNTLNLDDCDCAYSDEVKCASGWRGIAQVALRYELSDDFGSSLKRVQKT